MLLHLLRTLQLLHHPHKHKHYYQKLMYVLSWQYQRFERTKLLHLYLKIQFLHYHQKHNLFQM